MLRHRDIPPRAVLSVLLPVVAGGVALLALQPLGWRGALALLATAVAGIAAGALWQRERGRAALREARQPRQLLAQMLEVWLWQTDAQHRLVRLQPPQGAPATSWAAAAIGTEALWERFDDDARTLRSRLQAEAPLNDLVAVDLHDRGSRRWRLRGLPRQDGEGRFAGYLGTATPLDAAAEPAPAERTEAAPADDYAAFSYTISHDLRAPIRVIEGFARILKEDYAGALDRVANDHLDRVLSAAARMNAMIDAMLSLSRLSTQPLARQPVDLSRLAAHVADDLRRSDPERAAEIRIQPGLTAVGDPTLLRLALENLLGNAWKYSAKVARAQIGFEQVEQEGRRAFVVSDNGAGFDMRFADRLFGVFHRLHASSEFAGHGVGLASVRRIVQRHGGQIWAEAEVGRGARFYFTLGA